MRASLTTKAVLSGAAAAVVLVALAGAPGARPPRRPVALALAADGKRLFVADRDAGAVSVIDTEKRRVVAEALVGKRLADLTILPDGRLLAVDESAGELLVLSSKDDGCSVMQRLAVGLAPVCVRASADGRRAFVACLWGHELAVVNLLDDRTATVARRINLSMPPRQLLPLPREDKLLIADAFGGKLALADVRTGKLLSVREVPAHNIRGLALSGDGKRVVLAHQLLHEDTPDQEDNVRWGNVIGNGVRELSLEFVADPKRDLLEHSVMTPLGGFGRGAADPSGLACAGTRTIVTLGGTGEVVISGGGDEWTRVAMGRRPTVVVASADGRRAYVANTFSGTIGIVDLVARKSVGEVALGNASASGPAARGELLFYDARLSKEGWMSCHSCHTDGHTNGRRADTLGDGSYGAAKRVLSLLGVGQTGPWAWNGGMADLKTQIRASVRTTMHGSASDEQVADLEAFLRTLQPPPPLSVPTKQAARGKKVFESHGCARCHAAPTYTTPRTYDIGLADEVGKSSFNPPSLRGIGHAAAFFHDNRATGLEEVFTRFRHQLGRELSGGDLNDLVAFLRGL